jgi:hypothetical protein
LGTEAETGSGDVAARIRAASDVWISRLIDDTRANSLLFFRDLQVGTLDLSNQYNAVVRLLSGTKLAVEQIVEATESPDSVQKRQELADKRKAATKALVALRRKAKANLEEKGLETLFLAVGMASWPASDGGRDYASPVVLIPIVIETHGADESNLRVRIHGQPRINPVLLHILEKNFHIQVDGDAVIKGAAIEGEDSVWRIEPQRPIGEIVRAMQGERDFLVKDRAILGNFSFAKMAIVEDIKKNQSALVDSELVRGVAGDLNARRNLGKSVFDVEPNQLDERPISKDFLVLDADSTQVRAIVRTTAGQNAVIQGPPGTGKSQTIANLITQAVAEGKRVLFVAEKRAALEAVMKRLSTRAVDLAHITLDLHGASVSRKEVMSRIADTLHRIGHTPPPSGGEDHDRLYEERRRQLDAHARRINETRAPSGQSLIQMLGSLLRLPKGSESKIRLRSPAIERFVIDETLRVKQWLRDGTAYPSLFLGTDASPWNNAEIRDGGTAQRAIDEANRIWDQLWPAFESALTGLCSETGLAAPSDVGDTSELLRLLSEIRQILEAYEPDVFQMAADTAVVLEPASKGFFARLWAFLWNADYRDARNRMLGIRRSRTSALDLRNEALLANDIVSRWSLRTLDSTLPSKSSETANVASQLDALRAALDPIDGLLPPPATSTLPLGSAKDRLQRLAEDRRTPLLLPNIHQLRDRFRNAGLTALLEDLRAGRVDPALWLSRFDYIWLYSSVDLVFAAESDFAAFKGRTHQQLVDEFARLDEERLLLAARQVRRRHAETAIHAMNEHFDQSNLIRSEAAKKSRHMPLRDLLAQTPDVLTRIAPCWIASPLSVSQLLAGGAKYVDIVVFDEASQILPEEAIPSLYRSDQVVAAGDKHQLPPTTFFFSSDDEEDVSEQGEVERAARAEAARAVGGYESLLATLEAFLPQMPLDWHYRSADERLIAFSNQYIYNGRLITFPAAADAEVIRHIHVPHDPGLGNQDESSSTEVRKVVQEILRHAETLPNESLGVITMGIKHANRVQAMLDRELELRRDLSEFFALDKEDRFFIKNLETVQGDERDAIILSIGYGKASDGSLPHRFGPLTQDVGYRRLNVAVTRARRRMTLVSSFLAHEIDLNRSGSRGVQLLKSYLEYAATGGHRLQAPEVADEVELNAFESDIRDVLTSKGIITRSQFGASKYRIDIVAMHPIKQGRPILAIECDGASYHSNATARDRDRLRQEHLQRLGWCFHRIWSTDWFFARDEEIARLLESYDAAIRRADAIDSGAFSPTSKAAASPVSQQPSEPTPTRNGLQPSLSRKASIDDYSDGELLRYAQWVQSDGLLRTDEDMMNELFEALPFARRGARIRQRLERVVRRLRSARKAN